MRFACTIPLPIAECCESFQFKVAGPSNRFSHIVFRWIDPQMRACGDEFRFGQQVDRIVIGTKDGQEIDLPEIGLRGSAAMSV